MSILSHRCQPPRRYIWVLSSSHVIFQPFSNRHLCSAHIILWVWVKRNSWKNQIVHSFLLYLPLTINSKYCMRTQSVSSMNKFTTCNSKIFASEDYTQLSVRIRKLFADVFSSWKFPCGAYMKDYESVKLRPISFCWRG